MTATAHALVAGAIASKIPDPLAAAALALASHFIMDSVPHWDFGTNWRNRPKSIRGILAIAETRLAGNAVVYLFCQQKQKGAHKKRRIFGKTLLQYL
ncbi:MAG: hypothetical protein UY16_C0060G0002 [Candidatus Gottesmanbacteria bacterium GW2011_GWA2_47_9]|uniref:Uncharacterized protein n=1 Tax=Candidatus Gottesmanbacteria bacterium GW2011_GWA2_47_9 TaxID=1618445 RepID=A0A0G1TWJ8_9BACT|nr:MAG: hypothetical protein UY16_C0060G0002 [Candidatus Gottesmanbacteria bacterium GW2011_GWA2_47_9]